MSWKPTEVLLSPSDRPPAACPGVRRTTSGSAALRRLFLQACGLALALLAAGCGADGTVYGNPAPPDDAPRVVIETDFGNIVVGLYEEQAPISVDNFLAYVDAGFFDGTAFHRVLPGFMIQGGGYIAREGARFQRKDRRPTIALESGNGLVNARGAVAMARGGMPDTASSEFFINLVDNQRLDRLGDVELGYAVFGAVIEGMEVVDTIAAVETEVSPDFTPPGEKAAPVEDVVIRSIRRVN